MKDPETMAQEHARMMGRRTWLGWVLLIVGMAAWLAALAMGLSGLVSFLSAAEPAPPERQLIELDHSDVEAVRALLLGTGWTEVEPPPEMREIPQLLVEAMHRMRMACIGYARQAGVDPAQVWFVGLFRREPDAPRILFCIDRAPWTEDYARNWCEAQGWHYVSYAAPVVRCEKGEK